MTESKSYAVTDPRLHAYARSVFPPLDPILEAARARCRAASLPPIDVEPMDGLHLEILARATGATQVVEIGTLGGVSGISLARALPQGGILHTCEIHEKHASVARANFEAAGVADKVVVHVGPATATLEALAAEGPFDFVFLDADKGSYPAYARWAAENLRMGGVLVADNTFAWGLVIQDRIENPDHARAVRAMREFNAWVAGCGRFRATVLPTGEGLTVAVKVG